MGSVLNISFVNGEFQQSGFVENGGRFAVKFGFVFPFGNQSCVAGIYF